MFKPRTAPGGLGRTQLLVAALSLIFIGNAAADRSPIRPRPGVIGAPRCPDPAPDDRRPPGQTCCEPGWPQRPGQEPLAPCVEPRPKPWPDPMPPAPLPVPPPCIQHPAPAPPVEFMPEPEPMSEPGRGPDRA